LTINLLSGFQEAEQILKFLEDLTAVKN